MSHMCGLCLALRDNHGQVARIATNYDGLVVSVLTSAQSAQGAGARRAGRCPLRGMRGAEVADGSGAQLAAVVSLMLASAKIADHVADGDGLYARRGVRALAGRVAERWRHEARAAGTGLGFDGVELVAVADRQREAEAAAGPGTDVLSVTWPTEEATGEAFAYTAVLAGRPANAEALREAGRLFGRIAHLLDAVEDRAEDLQNNAWNPLTATGTGTGRARELCDDAVLGVRLALDAAELADGRLLRVLLVGELHRAVTRVFARDGYPGDPHPRYHRSPHQHGKHDHSGASTDDHQYGDEGGRGRCGTCSCTVPEQHHPPKQRGLLTGCVTALFMCCTCQFCCRDPHPGPWSGKPVSGWCSPCDCCDSSCCARCDCRDCCEKCSCCD